MERHRDERIHSRAMQRNPTQGRATTLSYRRQGSDAMVAVTMVRKAQKDKEEPFVPEIDLFPWHSWCALCSWKTTTGAWRDAFDLAHYHAIGGVHENPKPPPNVTAMPTALLYPTDGTGGAEAHRDGDPAGNSDSGGSYAGHGVPPGDPIREDTLDDQVSEFEEWMQGNPEFRGRW